MIKKLGVREGTIHLREHGRYRANKQFLISQHALFQSNQLVIVHAKQLVENSLRLECIPEGACWNFLKNNLITH